MNNSGKYLEDQFEEAFDKTRADVYCLRFADSKAARNLIKEQPADFLVAVPSFWDPIFFLECKSVKHAYRLPKFVQNSRMKRAAMAGIPGYVLVHHYIPDVYRLVNVAELELGKPSFDLRSWPERSWDEIKGVIL